MLSVPSATQAIGVLCRRLFKGVMSAQGSGRDAAAAAFARTALDAAVQDIPWDGEGEDAVLGEAWQLCLSLDGPPPRPTDFNTPEPVLCVALALALRPARAVLRASCHAGDSRG